jgi:3-oxoacyl-[acyl-carrier-protein] synthase II
MKRMILLKALILFQNREINKDLGIVSCPIPCFCAVTMQVFCFSRDKNTECNIKKNNNKVFITGLGIVSPIGLTKEGYWDNAINNISGISRLETNKNNYVANVKIEDFAQHGIEPGFLRKIDRLTKLLLISGRESLKDAGINVSDDFSDKIGLVVGTSDGPVSEIRNFLEGMIKRGIHSGSPVIFPNRVYNAACGYLSIIENIKGYALTLVNGISSGIDSVCHSYDMLKFGRQEIFIASGVDEYSETIHILYDTLNALYEGDEPSKQPFNFSQKGFIMGEGSTSIVLETEESANKRGACCYAEVIGYSHSNTPVGAGKLDKDGFGLDSAIKLACKNANIGLEEIDAIVGFANGSSDIDTMELKSYIRTFGNKFSSIPIYSVKSLTGEGRAAASSLQIAHAALMLIRIMLLPQEQAV